MLHIDRSLERVVGDYHGLTYLILFAIIFAETGLVATPFLPGDSLLFAVGAVAARPDHLLDIRLVAILLMLAAFLGDNSNYFIGKFLGPKILRSERSKWLNRKHLDRTHAFFERHGGKTIILARFVPIVRTFTPFVAGIGAMTYPRFLVFSIAATALWAGICLSAGYFFGGLPVVKDHFTLVVLGVVFVSVIPALVEIVRHKRSAASSPAENGL